MPILWYSGRPWFRFDLHVLMLTCNSAIYGCEWLTSRVISQEYSSSVTFVIQLIYDESWVFTCFLCFSSLRSVIRIVLCDVMELLSHISRVLCVFSVCHDRIMQQVVESIMRRGTADIEQQKAVYIELSTEARQSTQVFVNPNQIS